MNVRLVIANSPTAPATGVCDARNVPLSVYEGFVADTAALVGLMTTVVCVPTSG